MKQPFLLLTAALLTGLTPWCGFSAWAADPLAILYDSRLDVAVKGVLNAPHNYDEARVGTPLPILPAAGGDLIDAGTATAVRGLDNLIGPFLGAAPDVGAYEPGLGLPWVGPRHFANLLGYGLPQCWRVAALSELSDYTSLGAPNAVDANAFRLLLVTADPQKPKAFILTTFEEMQGEPRWQRLDEILKGETGDTVLIEPLEFRDGLGASIIARGNNAHLLGARVDDEGVLKVFAGVDRGSLSRVQDDLFTVVRSLWYAWYLQDVTNPISLNFVTPPAPDFVAVGSPAAPSTGNAVVPGTLHGDVTLTNASIIWDVEGDVNLNATVTVQFRRQGTAQWRDALDLFRVNFNDERWSGVFAQTRNRLTGSIFNLSPGATYEVRVTLTDPDGGGETRTTTFTTRSVPKVPQGGRIIEVRTTDNLDVLMNGALPGDTFLIHGGNYGVLTIRTSGTQESPILIHAFPGEVPTFSRINVENSHVWFDGLTVMSNLDTGVWTFLIGSRQLATNVAVTRSTVKNAKYSIHGAGTNQMFVSDNTVIGPGRTPLPPPLLPFTSLAYDAIDFGNDTRGHVVAYNDITGTFDGISTGDGGVDVHGNRIYEVADDAIEPDYAWDNIRMWENLTWDVGFNGGFSTQPAKGGPWYYFHNQTTGSKGGDAFKMREGGGFVVVGNAIVATNVTNTPGLLFEKGSVFSNNYWKVRSWNVNADYLGANTNPVPNPSLVGLWGYNRYDVHSRDDVWHWWGSLENAQALGAELNSLLVTNQGTEGLQIYEGTAVPLSSNAGAGSFTWSWSLSVNGGPEQLHSSGTGAIPNVQFDSKGLANRRVEWILRASDSAGAQEARLSIDVWPGSCGQGLPPSPTLCGDVNGDGVVDIRDVIALIRILTGADPAPQPGSDTFRRSDVNGDGTLNIADPVLLINFILGRASLSCRGG